MASTLISALLSFLACAGTGGPAAAEDPLALPSPEQMAWHDLELGMFVHLAPQTWQDSETDDLSIAPSAMNPEKLDTDQWVRVAESMRAKYIVFVAKHEGGFCWWPTETTDFCVKHSPWRGGKGDVLADLARSCRARGVMLGVYLSPQDKKHGIAVGGKAKTPEAQAEYERLFRRQLVEVLSQYGEMCEVWFDGSLVFDVGDILKQHAPRAVVFQGPQASIRWVGNEDGVAPDPAWNAVKLGKRKWGDYTAEDGDPDGDRWLPNECDARLRSTWFWNTTGEKTIKSVEQLMDMYCRSVGRGAVLLLNQTPDRSGAIPELDARRSAEFGAEIEKRFGRALAETSGSGLELELALRAPMRIESIVTMEDIARGERVRKYVIEGKVGGAWREIASGTAIGHKKIDRIAPGHARTTETAGPSRGVEVSAVRWRCLESAGIPVIRRLAVH